MKSTSASKNTHVERFLTKKQAQLLQKSGIIIRQNSNEHYSLMSLFKGAIARTGSSSYSKGYVYKAVWTDKVLAICSALRLDVEAGNDAPRGGALGEYVAATNRRQIAHNIRLFNRAEAEAKRKADEEEEFLAKLAENKKALIEAEAASIKIDEEFKKAVAWAYEVTGEEKSKRSASALKGLLSRNNIEKINTDFWTVFRILKNKKG